jgi:hypothetical protein
MVATEKEMVRLMGEHEGIRAHMRFIAKNLGDLAGQPLQVKERLWIYRWALLDFRDAVQRHVELDDRIFRELSDKDLSIRMDSEHTEIRKLLVLAIDLADRAVEGNMGEPELNQTALKINRTFDKVRHLIEEHTAGEDEIFKLTPQSPASRKRPSGGKAD